MKEQSLTHQTLSGSRFDRAASIAGGQAQPWTLLGIIRRAGLNLLKPLMPCLVVVMAGCATVGGVSDGVVTGATGADEAENAVLVNAQDDDAELLLPELELDGQSLENLLLSNLATFRGDWQTATDSTLDVAQTSGDFRIARLAAIYALRAKDYSSAVVAAKKWHSIQNDDASARTTLLLALLGAGDVEASLAEFDVDPQGREIDAYYREVAGILIRQPNAKAAMTVAQHYVDKFQASAQVFLSSSYVANHFERQPEAEQWLLTALALRPDWDLAAQMKVSMLRAQNKNAEAALYIDQFLTANPKSVAMRLNKAAELSRAKQYQEALDMMLGVLKDDPNSVSAMNYTAALAEQLSNRKLAKKWLGRTLRVEPANVEAISSLARFAVMEENYQLAEDLYLQVDDDAPEYFQAQLQVANMRYHTLGLKPAVNSLRVLRPNTQDEYIDIAITRHYLLMRDRQYEDAFGYINESLVYLPDDLQLRYARALVSAELEKISIAEQDFRHIIKRQPNHANALNALGYTLADQTDRFTEARELIEKALKLRPNDAHILDSMGWVLYRLKDLPNAIVYLQKAYEASPEVEVAAHLGEVFWENGQQAEAAAIWAQALAEDASNPILKDTLARYPGYQTIADQ